MLELLKSLKPSFKSKPNIISQIQDDHEVLRSYLKEIEGAQESSQKVEKILVKFMAELTSHSRAEEKSFYVPFIAKNKESEIHVLEGFEEHMLIDTITNKLMKAEPGSTVFQARFKVVCELLEHHLKDEEKEHLPLAKKNFSEKELENMGTRYHTLKHGTKSEKGTVRKNLAAAKKKNLAKKKTKKEP